MNTPDLQHCDIHDATFVQLRDGSIHPIREKWGIHPSTRQLAPPSKGGFGCVTTSGQRVGMMEALSYYRGFEHRDIDEYIKATNGAEEDYEGQRREAQRQMIIEASIAASERILLRYSDGAEELNFLTAQVANRYSDKVLLAFQFVMLRKELIEKNTASKRTDG